MSTDHHEPRLVARDHGAPTIYFDSVPTAGVRDGVAGVVLSMAQNYPESGRIATDHVVVAHLRTSVKGLLELKRAVEGALLLAMPAQGQSGPKQAN